MKFPKKKSYFVWLPYLLPHHHYHATSLTLSVVSGLATNGSHLAWVCAKSWLVSSSSGSLLERRGGRSPPWRWAGPSPSHTSCRCPPCPRATRCGKYLCWQLKSCWSWIPSGYWEDFARPRNSGRFCFTQLRKRLSQSEPLRLRMRQNKPKQKINQIYCFKGRWMSRQIISNKIV